MVGYAQDTFLSSEFDVTALLKPGSNHLAVQASSYGIAILSAGCAVHIWEKKYMTCDSIQLSLYTSKLSKRYHTDLLYVSTHQP